MTRRKRLEALEAALTVQDLEVISMYWADTEAGVWREGVGALGEEPGRTLPLNPEEAADIEASGRHVILFTGLPARGGRR